MNPSGWNWREEISGWETEARKGWENARSNLWSGGIPEGVQISTVVSQGISWTLLNTDGKYHLKTFWNETTEPTFSNFSRLCISAFFMFNVIYHLLLWSMVSVSPPHVTIGNITFNVSVPCMIFARFCCPILNYAIFWYQVNSLFFFL